MATVPVATSDLVDPEFLAALARLRISARRVPRGGRHAEHRSRDLGSGIEFRDFRPYSPGDDFRSIDWNIYQRLGRVVLRLFEELEDLPLYLLPDVSRSSFAESPPRGLAGLRCALALAAIGLQQHDRVGIYPVADDLGRTVPPKAGKDRVLEFAQRLSEIELGGGTDLARALTRFGALRLRTGLAVLISDFFDPAGIEPILAALSRLRHRLLLLRLVRASDRDPTLTGDVRLIDCESGIGEDLTITPDVLTRYRATYDAFSTRLADFARQRGVGLLEVDVERDVLAQLAAVFEGGRLQA